MKRSDFEKQKQALLKEINQVLVEVEHLYDEGVERGVEETKALKNKLEERLEEVKFKLNSLEERASEQVRQQVKAADEYINEKPYYAMGFAALAGLVVGVLLNRR